MNTTIVCAECGGKNIQCRVWVDANTNECLGGDGYGHNDRWCDDCQEHTDFCLEENYIA